MKFFLNQTVHDAALDRIRYLFDEFETVVVGFSGGKDSTVILNLALMVAQEKGRLPLPVLFLDQEAEWQGTVDTVRRVMEDPDVLPLWIQCPIRLFNATSTTEHWLMCWDPAKRDLWMHEQVEYAIKDNIFGTDRFGEMFGAMLKTLYPHKACYLGGVRAEESPVRSMGLTESKNPTYKGVTWGKKLNRPDQFTFYPIYDWSYTDVWKAIHDNHWHYNPVYDAMYQYGVQVRQMRISNVHHETAVHSLFMLQEIEPATYERLTQRIAGIDMAGKMGALDYWPSKCPSMFSGWIEYRDYLLEKLITDHQWKRNFVKRFQADDRRYGKELGDVVPRMHIASILTNDWEGIKLDNFERRPAIAQLRNTKKAAGTWS